MSFKTFKRTNGKYYKTDIVDFTEHLKCVSGFKDADCVCDSLELFYKLRKAGAKRVRGRRQVERDTRDPDAFHYWVENNDIVFDKHGGVQTIIDKTMYYINAEISDVEVAEYSGFFRDELPDGLDDVLDEMKKGWRDRSLLLLINTYRKKFGLKPLVF